MMNRIKTKFDKMPIVKKVTILYAFLFTVTIAAISVILLITSKGMGVGIAFTTLQNCSETIENYIVSGNDLSGENIESLFGGNYVDYIIENKSTGEVYISQNFLPSNSPTPFDRDDFSDNIEEDFNLYEKTVRRPYFKIIEDYDSYTIYTKNGHEFISIENEFVYQDTVYTVKFLSTFNPAATPLIKFGILFSAICLKSSSFSV